MAKKLPLDLYDDIPRDMRTYLQNYGWHFVKRSVAYAVEMMKRRNPATGKMERIDPYTKEQVDEMLSKYGVKLEKSEGLDYIYVANMAKADFLKSSIADEQHLALYVKDVVDDPDAADGTIMRRWYAGVVANGDIVDWEDMI